MALIATIGGLGYFSSESSLTIWTVLLLCGIGMLLLSVLPTEKRLVKFVSFAVLVTLVTGARFIAGYTYEYAHFSQVRDDCGAPALEPGQSCWVHLLIVCAFGLSTAVWSLSVGWLLKVLWKRPSSRHLLDSLWQAVGFSYIAYALAQVRGVGWLRITASRCACRIILSQTFVLSRASPAASSRLFFRPSTRFRPMRALLGLLGACRLARGQGR